MPMDWELHGNVKNRVPQAAAMSLYSRCGSVAIGKACSWWQFIELFSMTSVKLPSPIPLPLFSTTLPFIVALKNSKPQNCYKSTKYSY